MNIPVNLWMWCGAALPIAVLVILMVWFQWSAAKAAPVGLAAALLTALLMYKVPVPLVGMESAKAVWSAAQVIFVVWPAILIYEVTQAADAFRVFRKGMQRIAPNELLQILAVGWCFVSFLQGITGFGVPIAVGAPLLMGIGVSPIGAVMISLLGQAWGNTFGTLAVAWQALLLQTNLSDGDTVAVQAALWAAAFLWIFNFITGIAICWIYGKKVAVKKGMLAVTAISAVQGGGQLLLSQVNPTLCAFVPACAALGAVVLLGRMKCYNHEWHAAESAVMTGRRSRPEIGEALAETAHGCGEKRLKPSAATMTMTMTEACLPYILLTAVTLLVLLIDPLKRFLGAVKIGIGFPRMETGYGFVVEAVDSFSPFAPFTDAGFFLLLAAVLGFLYFRKQTYISAGGLGGILRESVKKTIPSAVAIIGFTVMSRIMSGAGGTMVLAQGIAAALGVQYVLFAPLIGALGSFMTSSNMSSNILFGEFQHSTAAALGLSQAPVLGAQTAGGAVGSMICPAKIVLGTTTAGIPGAEGAILRKVMPIVMALSLLYGIMLYGYYL